MVITVTFMIETVMMMMMAMVMMMMVVMMMMMMVTVLTLRGDEDMIMDCKN